MSMLRFIWAYHGFVLKSVKREFKSTCLNLALAICWVVLLLAMILVYILIFSKTGLWHMDAKTTIVTKNRFEIE